MFLHLKVGAPAPLELTQWNIAERYGWTLAYIRSLSVDEIHQYVQVQDAKYKASK